MAFLRTEVIVFRLTPTEKANIDAAARRLDMTTAAYIRMVMAGSATVVLGKPEFREQNWQSTGRLVMSYLGEDMNIQGAEM